MAIKAHWTVQTSEGNPSRTGASVSMVIGESAYLRCQANPVGPGKHAITLDIGYDGSFSLHGSLADLRRMAELLRTTLEEYGDGPDT